MGILSNGNGRIRVSNKRVARAKKSRFTREGVETVVEVKTVGDIPPVLEARRLIGEGNFGDAARVTFKAAKDDYIRYFAARASSSDGNRYFFINELANFKVRVPEAGFVDNTTVLEAFDQIPSQEEFLQNRVNALKKLAFFYLNYYEKARFAVDLEFSGEDLIEGFSEIYNYMDVMKLYFSGAVGKE